MVRTLKAGQEPVLYQRNIGNKHPGRGVNAAAGNGSREISGGGRRTSSGRERHISTDGGRRIPSGRETHISTDGGRRIPSGRERRISTGSGRRISAGRNPAGADAMTVDQGNIEAVRNRRRIAPSTSMSLRTVILMMLVTTAMTAALIYYIKVQSDVTATSREIAGLEQQLTEMRAENDAAYNEINDSISLEEIREKAIHELGMKYADRDQVVIYSGAEQDAVHQVSPVDGN